MFHPRGMGPRGGMRPGMRPPFGPRGPFDSREGDAFFRLPFDDNRGPPGNMMRPPFGPPGPPMSSNEPIWRNQENGPPPGTWSPNESGNGHESDDQNQRDNHLTRDNQKNSQKNQESKNDRSERDRDRDRDRDRENRNRNRKSRWANASPPPADHIDVLMSENDVEEDSKMRLDASFDANDNSQSFNDLPDPPGVETKQKDIDEFTAGDDVTNVETDASDQRPSANETNHREEVTQECAENQKEFEHLEDNRNIEEVRTFAEPEETKETQIETSETQHNSPPTLTIPPIQEEIRYEEERQTDILDNTGNATEVAVTESQEYQSNEKIDDSKVEEAREESEQETKTQDATDL